MSEFDENLERALVEFFLNDEPSRIRSFQSLTVIYQRIQQLKDKNGSSFNSLQNALNWDTIEAGIEQLFNKGRLQKIDRTEASYRVNQGREVVGEIVSELDRRVVAGGHFVPAADRVVKLDHNQVQELEVPLNEVLQALERENGDIADPPLRQRVVGQLRAGRELVRAGEFNAYLLYLTVFHALNELIERYGGKTLAALANALLGVLAAKVFQ